MGGYEAAGTDRTLSEIWNGTNWSINLPPNESTSNNVLYGVSCTSSTNCVAVGYTESSGVDETLIESWNGSNWAITPSPNNQGSGLNNVLDGVSCSGVDQCSAVGFYQTTADPSAYCVPDHATCQTLAENWNGSRWSIVATPDDGSNDNALAAVSCVSPTFCVGTGDYSNGTVDESLIETWNGTSWSVAPSPNPGTQINFLNTVTCTSATYCVTAGYYENKINVASTLIESWNGTNWSIAPSPNQGTVSNFLQGISCTSTTDCDVVGWSGQPIPQPGGAGVSEPDGAASPSGSQTLIEAWDGTSWSISSSQNAGSQVNTLFGASCVSPADCQAAGFEGASGMADTLVETNAVVAGSGYSSSVLANNPSAYFKFDDPVGSTTFADSVPEGPTATAVPMTSPTASTVESGVPGTGDGALSLGNGYATFPPLDPLSGGNARTVELWFNTTNENGTLIGAGDPSNEADFQVTLTSGGLGNKPPSTSPGVFIEMYGDDVYVPTSDLADGQWHYLAVSISGTQVNVVIDHGQPEGATWNGKSYSKLQAQPLTLPFAPDTAPTPVSIGPSFVGLVAEVAIYPTALTPAQMAAHYGSGVAADSNSMVLTGGAVYGVTNRPITGQLATLTDGSTNIDPGVYHASVIWDLVNQPDVADATIVQGVEGATPPGPQPVCPAAPGPCHPQGGTFAVFGNHTYTAPGNYEVKVTITRDDGSTVSTILTAQVAPRCTDKLAKTVAGQLQSDGGNTSLIDDNEDCLAQFFVGQRAVRHARALLHDRRISRSRRILWWRASL